MWQEHPPPSNDPGFPCEIGAKVLCSFWESQGPGAWGQDLAVPRVGKDSPEAAGEGQDGAGRLFLLASLLCDRPFYSCFLMPSSLPRCGGYR